MTNERKPAIAPPVNEAKLRATLPILRPMGVEGIFVLLDADVIPLP